MNKKLQLGTGISQVFWNNDTFHATGLGLYRQPYTYNSSFIIHYHTPGKNYLRTIYFCLRCSINLVMSGNPLIPFGHKALVKNLAASLLLFGLLLPHQMQQVSSLNRSKCRPPLGQGKRYRFKKPAFKPCLPCKK